MAERRGLFETVFGKPKAQDNKSYTAYQLLSSYQSSFVPFSGNAWDVGTVRAAIHSFARRAACVQPKHIRRADGKIIDITGGINYLLRTKPNPYSTAFKFYYKIATDYKLYNNSFVFPVWATNGKLEALYNVNASKVNLLDYHGEMYVQFTFYGGKTYTFPYTEVIHIGSMYGNNDIFGSDNLAILPVLDTANTFNQSMSKFAELVAIVRGILEVNASTKDEDLNAKRDKFIKDNLKMENNGAGVIVTDQKYKYTPIQDKQTPIPEGQLTYIKNEIYDYFGTNEKIVQNKANSEEEDSFYEGEIRPFLQQLEQAFTSCLFTSKEIGYGNEIVAEGDKLQHAKLSDKLNAVKYLSDIGALEIDQALTTLGFPPIGGEEGKRRVQTLNVVNANLADKYQLGDDEDDEDDEPEDKDPSEENNPDEGKEEEEDV